MADMKAIPLILTFALIGCGLGPTKETATQVDALSQDGGYTLLSGSGRNPLVSNNTLVYSLYAAKDGSGLVTCGNRQGSEEQAATFFVLSGNTACVLYADVDAPSGGYWTFTEAPYDNNNVVTATYTDKGSKWDGYNTAFVAN